MGLKDESSLGIRTGMLGFWKKLKDEVMLENMFCIFLLTLYWWCLLVRRVEWEEVLFASIRCFCCVTVAVGGDENKRKGKREILCHLRLC